MATNKIEIPRGDTVESIFFYFPVASWTAGGILFFAVKPVIDDDVTDAAAVINKNYDDTDIVGEEEKNGELCKKYQILVEPADTFGIDSNGAKSISYLAEFQFVAADGTVITFPPVGKKIDCVVTFDVKRKTTV